MTSKNTIIMACLCHSQPIIISPSQNSHLRRWSQHLADGPLRQARLDRLADGVAKQGCVQALQVAFCLLLLPRQHPELDCQAPGLAPQGGLVQQVVLLLQGRGKGSQAGATQRVALRLPGFRGLYAGLQSGQSISMYQAGEGHMTHYSENSSQPQAAEEHIGVGVEASEASLSQTS